jgi:predicted lipoprotein
MKKIIKVALLIVALFVAIWFSFYTEPLDVHRQKELIKQFSPNQLVDYHWKDHLDTLLSTAIDYSEFDKCMRSDARGFSEKHAKIPGIGAKSYFLVKGDVVVNEVSDEAAVFEFAPGINGKILVKFIFSNTARDVSGWFNASDFQNTMDYNTLSTYLNSRILTDVVKPVKDSLTKGAKLSFWGGIEISPEDYPVKTLELVPLRLILK